MNQDIWEAQLENQAARVPEFIEPQALQDVLAAARASQKREHNRSSKTDERNSTLRQLVSGTTHDVNTWLAKKKVERNHEGKFVLNAEQFLCVEKVAKRVMQELRHACRCWQERLRRVAPLARTRRTWGREVSCH